MNGHSDYIMMPGARLEVGPHGELEESLGACCSACEKIPGSCGGNALGVGPLDNQPTGIMDYLAVPGFTVLNAIGVARISYAGTPPTNSQADLVEVAVGGGLAYLVYRLFFKKKSTTNPSRRIRTRQR